MALPHTCEQTPGTPHTQHCKPAKALVAAEGNLTSHVLGARERERRNVVSGAGSLTATVQHHANACQVTGAPLQAAAVLQQGEQLLPHRVE
jgi:hypothetical protein